MVYGIYGTVSSIGPVVQLCLDAAGETMIEEHYITIFTLVD